ncbi:MAG: hypothetical protein ACQEV7_04255 [Bacillota bacterium]
MFIKVFLWLSLIVPWLSLFFMKKDSIKRYLPVAILVSLLLTILYEIGYTYDWWVLKDKIVPWGHITNISFAYGLFLISTIWIFHYTYRNFKLYMVTNIIVDAIFNFGVLKLTERFGINKLINMPDWGIYLIMLGLALIIYIYQRWQEGIFKEE